MPPCNLRFPSTTLLGIEISPVSVDVFLGDLARRYVDEVIDRFLLEEILEYLNGLESVLIRVLYDGAGQEIWRVQGDYDWSSEDARAAIDAAIAEGIAIVMAPRVLAGRTLERTYRIPGAETDLIDRGVIPAGHTSGHKARLRIMVGLALDRDVRSLFPVL